MSCQSEKRDPRALSGVWGKGNVGIVCYKTDGFSCTCGWSVLWGRRERGIVGPLICLNVTLRFSIARTMSSTIYWASHQKSAVRTNNLGTYDPSPVVD
jgi:hypothetical protein